MSAYASVAQRLHDRGFHVFPVDHPDHPECIGLHHPIESPCDGNRGKHPAVKWGTWAVTVTPKMIDLAWGKHGGLANIAISCGPSGLVVLDEDAPGEIERWCVTYGVTLPDTYTVATGRGRHLYFSWDHATQPIGNSPKAMEDFKADVRGHGGLVVAEGSQHASGAVYTGNGEPIADLPDQVAQLLLAGGKREPEPAWEDVATDHQNTKVAYPRRHNALVAYAGRLRKSGLDHREAQVVFRERWLLCEQPEGQIPEAHFHSPACPYPVTWDEATAKLGDVYGRYAAGQNIEDDVPDDVLARMFNGAWLDAQEFPPLQYAVPGIIPEGFGLLVSPPKTGKSWLVCGIGLACAAGGSALGRINVDKRPVFYLALEDGQRRLQSRSRHIMSGQPIPAGIHFITKAKPAEVIPMISEFLQRYSTEKPLIVLDTLGKARPPRPAGTDLYAWDYSIGGQLKDTIDAAPGATLLAVHHTRKTESSDFVDSVSGSQGIAGSADFVLALSRKRYSDEALLSVTGRDVTEAEYALTSTGGLWQLDGPTLAGAAKTAQARREQGQLGDRALEVLGLVNGRESTRAADLTAIGINGEQARVYLNRLADAGRIQKTGRGLYTPVTSVMSVTSEVGNVTDITLVTPLFADDD